MVTRLQDLIVPEVFVPYVIQRTTEKSRLFQSGIMTRTEQIDSLVTGASNTFIMPFLNDLSGRSQVLSETQPLQVKKITSGQDQAVKHYKGDAWGASDLSSALSGADPMGAVAELLATYWARDMQRTLIATLQGVFASASMATNVHDISIANGTGVNNMISATATIDAFMKLGDEEEGLTAIALHSLVYGNLRKQNLIEFEPVSTQGEKIATYLGKRVIVDDMMPRLPGNRFVSYLFGAGVIGYGEGNPNVAAEVDRDSLQGEDYLINRKHFAMHPFGVRWNGTSAGISPTDAELQAAAAWLRVVESKKVKIVSLVSNG